MAFTKYKTLAEVLKKYQIKYNESHFQIITDLKVPEILIEDLAFTFDKIAYQVSEAAICENLIYPVLKSVFKHYSEYFALWSHQPIEYDSELSGIPDYMISKRSSLGKIVFDSPFVAVVEAKKDDFTGGWAQCGLEMYAIQKINSGYLKPLFGIVSNGETWEFGQLHEGTFTMFKERFDIAQLAILYNVISSIFERCIEK